MSGILQTLFLGAAAAVKDAYFNLVTLLLNTTATNGAQNNTFLDSSSNNFTITRNGNTTQGTFTPFSQTGWGNYFNGTTDFLSLTTTSALTLGTNNFTVEYFYYVPDTVGGQGRISWGAAGSPNIYLGTGALVTYTNFATSVLLTSSIPCTANAWNHIAVVRNSGTTKIYINGVSGGSVADTTNWSIGSGTFRIMSSQGTDYSSGYVSNLRIVNGTAVYTSNFTPPTSPLTAITNTVLLTCQNNRFVDNSSNNYTITANGTPSAQAFSPFAPAYITPTTYSNWFNGSTGYLTVPSNAAFSFGTGSFTWETWFYSTGTYASGDDCFYDLGSANTTGGFAVFITGGLLYVRINGTGQDLTYSLTASWINTWHHLAVVRNGTTLTIYLDGVSVASGTRAQDVTQSSPYIGNGAGVLGAYYFSGCLSNMRVVKGTAVYTANFTPPTAPLTAISGTSLLTCQNSTFIDNSSNNFTITASGNVRPVASPTPFAPTVETEAAAYSTTLVGGSGYFDGTGDFLSVPDNSALEPGSSVCCFEFWYYPTSISSVSSLLSKRANGSSNGSLVLIRGAGSSSVLVYLSSTGSGWDIASGVSMGSVVLNQWNHLALYRISNTWYGAMNGVVTTVVASNSAAIYNGTTAWYIGAESDGQSTTGYLSGNRIVIGSSVYTAGNFAPPITPPTAITNTQLLLNYTNAGIYDSTAKNDLETLGTAQVSTTQSNFGNSSMSFPGTAGSFLQSPASSNWAFGTGDFTVELWFYTPTIATRGHFVCNRTTALISWELLLFSSTVRFANNGGFVLSSGTALSSNTWYHVAAVRSGTTLSLYINGVFAASTTDSSNYSEIATLRVGSLNASTFPFNGYIDELRITKGYARYTANFTPPSAPFPIQ